MGNNIVLDQVTVGFLGVNCYILYKNDSENCILIDPGDNYNLIENKLKSIKKTPTHVLLTHGHFDHIGAVKYFQEKGAIVYIHKGDLKKVNGETIMHPELKQPPLTPNILLNGGEDLVLNYIKIKVIYTPGHSKGSVCYIVENTDYMFTGDTLFRGDYGRTDLYDGNSLEMIDSLTNILFKIDHDYIVLPGHGPSSSLNFEKQYNPINRDKYMV